MSRPAYSEAEIARPHPLAVVELLKPVTWFAPMWAYGCGAISAGVPFNGRVLEVLAGVLLAGPLVCGTSQAVNDWFDRHVDAINEPKRPIPSGRIPGNWGFIIAVTWTVLSLAVAMALGWWTLTAAAVGLALAWAYSAPPLRLKQDGWYGNAAVAACYEGLPWFTGAAIMAGTLPDWRIITIAMLYSVGAHGIMVLNDFKSIGGDKTHGIRSIPAQLGADRAARLACIVMAAAQIAVVAMLVAWQAHFYAALVALGIAVQFALMRRLLADPRANAPWYNATGTSLYVLGMLASAFALADLMRLS